MNSAYAIVDTIFGSFWAWLGFYGPVTLWVFVWAVVRIEQARNDRKRPKILDPTRN